MSEPTIATDRPPPEDPDPSPPLLHADARLALRPLSVTPHGEESLVGDPAAGEFVAVPSIAVAILDALREGRPLSEVATLAAERAGEAVDVLDFARTILDLGFVVEIDGRAVTDVPDRNRRSDGGRLGAWLARRARPLFSPVAWTAYGMLFVACATLVIADRRLHLRGSDLLFLHNPAYSAGCLFVISMLFAAAHECAHWLAARVLGVPANITISRRLYLLVLQTDLTGIWSLPPRRRLGPILAGMALDTVRLAILLAAYLTSKAGLWHPTTTLARLIMALIAATTAGIAFQFFVFLRTDIYALLITMLGCVNLTRVTELLLKRLVVNLPRRDQEELDAAARRDVQVGRWYRWIYLAGLVAAAWFLVDFFGPNIITIARWTGTGLGHSSPSQPTFWQNLVLGSLALAPVLLTAVVAVRGRLSPPPATDRQPPSERELAPPSAPPGVTQLPRAGIR